MLLSFGPSADPYIQLQEFHRAERCILDTLHWEVSCVTPMCYLKYFLWHMPAMTAEMQQHAHREAVLLLGLSLQDARFTSYEPSRLAAAAVMVCMRCFATQMVFAKAHELHSQVACPPYSMASSYPLVTVHGIQRKYARIPNKLHLGTADQEATTTSSICCLRSMGGLID